MNSIIQCLNVSLPFGDELLRLQQDGLKGISASLCATFLGIRGEKDAKGFGGSFSPKQLKDTVVSKFPWYRGKEQHDAHEFLRTLLGSVADDATAVEEKERAEKGEKPPAFGAPGDCERCISRSFRGHLVAATLCWTCKRVSLQLDPFLDLSLDLPSLHGEACGALGVQALEPSAASGAAPSPEAGGGDGSGSERDEEGGKHAKARKAKKAEEAAAKAKATPKRPGGVWGAAVDKEELQESIRSYVMNVVVRAVRREEEAEAPEEPEAPAVETELARKGGKSWGFKWSEQSLGEEVLKLVGVVEDSPLDKHNLRRRATGDEELVICVGDRLVEVNGETEHAAMRAVLKSEEKVALRFVRGPRGPNASKDDGCAESDTEVERRAEQAAAKAKLKQDFLDGSTQCYETLAEELRDIFGPERARQGNGSLELEDCLQRFATCEAMEDDFKPSYSCAECKAAGLGKTFASRRMWPWEPDLPPLLTLQMKRFRRYRNRFEKSTASIVLPPTLSLDDYVMTEGRLEGLKPHLAKGVDLERIIAKGSAAKSLQRPVEGGKYELYSICVHQGATMGSGHYIAFVNNGPSLEKEDWYGLSDTKVWSCTRAEVLKAEAYVAFYRREGVVEAMLAAEVAKVAEDEQTVDEEQVEEDEPADGEEAAQDQDEG